MDLIEYLTKKMSMTEIYQPVIIKELLCSGGSATKDELARKLAEYDLSVVEHYKRILMRWPKITLTKHGIVFYEKQGQIFQLTVMPESQTDRDEAIKICEANVEKWLLRKQDSDRTVLGTASVRYQVLKQAHGKCQLCGIPAALRPIDIDHIVPRSKADKNGRVNKDGKLIDVNAPENLQALCFECNRSKRDTDC